MTSDDTNAQCALGTHNKCGGKVSGRGACECKCHPFAVIVRCPACTLRYKFHNPYVNRLARMYGATTDCPACDSLLLLTSDDNSAEAIQERGYFLPIDFYVKMRADITRRTGMADEQVNPTSFGSIDLCDFPRTEN